MRTFLHTAISPRRRVALHAAVLALLVGTAGAMTAAQADAVDRMAPNSGFAGYLFNLFPQLFTFNVHCDKGGRLSTTLHRIENNLFLANARVDVRVRGTCYEQIEVRTDNVHLIGLNGATLDGGGAAAPVRYPGVVSVQGARGFSLSGFTVRNGPQHGIYSQRGAEVRLSTLLLTGHARTGLTLEDTSARLHDVVATGNGTVGIDIYDGSTVIASGQLDGSGNAIDGITVNGNSLLELRGANATASENGGNGMLVANQSQVVIFDFPEAGTSSITANANGAGGLFIASAALYVTGGTPGSGEHLISASQNLVGMLVPMSGEIASPLGSARFMLSGNDAGMILGDGSSALFVGGLEVTGNGVGVSADAAGTMTVVSTPPNPSSITGNGADLSVVFGSRVTLAGADVGAITCDGGFVRGSSSCP